MLRRNRRDLISRDFHCPCGKAYLSYPALHTHIKKYHEDSEDMLDKAVIPQRQKGKRGRPVHTKLVPISEEFQELTFIENSILKIYQSLSKDLSEPILLQGNEDLSQSTLQQEYRQKLRCQASNEVELLAPEQLNEYEQVVRSLMEKLIKHFTVQISVRLKVMLVVGYVQHQIEGSRKEECVIKMAPFGWGLQHRLVAEVLYDVLMRALQRHLKEHDLFTSNES